MKKKSIIAILISFILGITIQLYIGDYNHAPDLVNKIASLIGGGLGILIAVIAFPLLLSLILLLINKKFPNDTFTILTYIILAIISILMFVGYSNIKANTDIALDEIEDFRKLKMQDCINVTTKVYDQIETLDKELIKERSKEYCICLYQKISRNDLKRVIDKDVLLPDLLNIEYSEKQDECFELSFNDIDITKMEHIWETDEEKINFWSSKLVSYYLMEINDFKSNILIEVLDCFQKSFKSKYLNKISDWEKRELTATEIFNEMPSIKNEIEKCYNSIK